MSDETLKSLPLEDIHKQAGAQAASQGSGSPADYIPASSV